MICILSKPPTISGSSCECSHSRRWWAPGHISAAAGTCSPLSSTRKPGHKWEREFEVCTGSILTGSQSISCHSCLSSLQFCSPGPFWHCHSKLSLPSNAPADTASCLEDWSGVGKHRLMTRLLHKKRNVWPHCLATHNDNLADSPDMYPLLIQAPCVKRARSSKLHSCAHIVQTCLEAK